MKLDRHLFLLATTSAYAFALLNFSQKVLAKECPFDSYIIIDRKCHDMTPEKPTPTVHKTVDTYSDTSSKFSDLTSGSLSKECSDFKYQESAQRHFENYPEHKHLDNDRDGYACDHLSRLSNDALTVEIWRKLLYENVQRKNSTQNKESLSYSEVMSIIGFPPNASTSSRTVWEDSINNMAIKIRFHDGKIVYMKGIGF